MSSRFVRLASFTLLLWCVGCGPSAPRFDPEAAVQRSLEKFRAATLGAPAERAALTAAAVAALFADPTCRDAAARVAFAAPAARGGEMKAAIRTCGRRYCPSLPEPRPAACASLDVADDAALGLLVEAIHEHDLGSARLARLKQEMQKIAESAGSGRR